MPTKIALITGAAQGIGHAIAIRLADDGLDIAVNDIAKQNDALNDLVKIIESKGRRSIAVVADVSVENDVKAMIFTVVETLGGLDVVRVLGTLPVLLNPHFTLQMVANAGILRNNGLLCSSSHVIANVIDFSTNFSVVRRVGSRSVNKRSRGVFVI